MDAQVRALLIAEPQLGIKAMVKKLHEAGFEAATAKEVREAAARVRETLASQAEEKPAEKEVKPKHKYRAKEEERLAYTEACRAEAEAQRAAETQRVKAAEATEREEKVREAHASWQQLCTERREETMRDTAASLREVSDLMYSMPIAPDSKQAAMMIRSGDVGSFQRWVTTDVANANKALDNMGDTVLHIIVAPPPEGAPTAQAGITMLDAALAAGADVNRGAYYGRTPLIIAAGCSGKPWACEWLLRAGALTTAKDGDGMTAIDLALQFACACPQLLASGFPRTSGSVADYDACVAHIVEADKAAARALLRRHRATARGELSNDSAASIVFSRRLEDELLVADGLAKPPQCVCRASRLFGELSMTGGISNATLERLVASGLPGAEEFVIGGIDPVERKVASMGDVFGQNWGNIAGHQNAEARDGADRLFPPEQRKRFLAEHYAFLSRAQRTRFDAACEKALRSDAMGWPDEMEAAMCREQNKKPPQPPKFQQEWCSVNILEAHLRQSRSFPDGDEARLARVATHKNAGNEFFKLKRWRDAISEYTAALAAAPHSVPAADCYNNRAAAHAALEEWDAAFMNASFAVKRLEAISVRQLADRERTSRSAAKAARRAVEAALRMNPGHGYAIMLAKGHAMLLEKLLVESPSLEGANALKAASEAFQQMEERDAAAEKRREEGFSLMKEAVGRKRQLITTAVDGVTPIDSDSQALPTVTALSSALQASCNPGLGLRMVLVEGPAREGIGGDCEADWGDLVSCLRPADPFLDVGGVLSVSAQFNPDCAETSERLKRRGMSEDEITEDAKRCHISRMLRDVKARGGDLAAKMPNFGPEEKTPAIYTMTITVKGFLSARGATRYFVATRDAHSELPPLPSSACEDLANVEPPPRHAAFLGDSMSYDPIADDDLRCATLLLCWKRWWLKITANFARSKSTAAESLGLLTAAARASLEACCTFRAWPVVRCSQCAKALSGGDLKKCSGCECAFYCSEACQRAAWPLHKPSCKKLAFEWSRAAAGQSYFERTLKMQHAQVDASLEAMRSQFGRMQAEGKMSEEVASALAGDCPMQ